MTDRKTPPFSSRPIPCVVGITAVLLGFIMLITTWNYNNDHPDEPQCMVIDGGIHSWFKTLGYSTMALGLMLLIWAGGISRMYMTFGWVVEAFFLKDTCHGAFGRFLVIAAAAFHIVINGYGHGVFYRAHNHPKEEFRIQTENEEHKWNYCAPGLYNFALATNVMTAIAWGALISWAAYAIYMRFFKEPGVSRKVFREEKWGQAEMILQEAGIDLDRDVGEMSSVVSA